MLELANKLVARYALIVGDNEIATQSYVLKEMSTGEQTTLSRPALLDRLEASKGAFEQTGMRHG
jgi:histidyl-tRNA synthetase